MMAHTPLPDIHTLVPHAGAMVLLDRLITADEHGVCAEVMIRPDSIFCDGAQVGAWIGIEYMAQAIGAHVGLAAMRAGETVKIGFLLGTRRYTCHVDHFLVGSVLRVVVQCELFSRHGVSAFACRITDVADRELAVATLTVFQPEDGRAFLHDIEREGSQ